MNKAYFLAQKDRATGAPVKPLGTDDVAGFLAFDDFGEAMVVFDRMKRKIPRLAVFEINVVIVGEALSTNGKA